MSLNASEQELYEFGMQAVPSIFRDHDRVKEDLQAMAKMAGATKVKIAHWLSMGMIGNATGASGSDPDWLELHASDRGTMRANGETDPIMRERIRNTPDGVTRASILMAAQALITASGVDGTVGMVELPRDGMFLNALYVADTGTGATITSPTGLGDVWITPTVKFKRPPFFQGLSGRVKSTRIVLSGASSSGNNGTFTITGLEGNAVRISNFAAIGGTDTGITWRVERLNVFGNSIEGAGNAYLNRGNRLSSRFPTMVIMLPLGTSAGTVASIKEMVRQKKAAGVLRAIEVRTA